MKNALKTWMLFSLYALAIPGAAAWGTETWRFKTGARVLASPLVHEGVVYIGGLDSVFYALDTGTGVERWRFKTDNPILTTASEDNGTILFECGNRLYGLDAQGSLKWKTDLAPEPVVNQHDEWDIYRSSPAVNNGIAYIGSEAGNVYGVNTATGAVVLHGQTSGNGSNIETRPLVVDGKIYVGDWNGVLYALDRATGLELWKYDTRLDKTHNWANAIQTEIVSWNGALFFGGKNCFLFCLNSETGKKNWAYHDPYDMWMLGGPTLYDSVLYIGSSNQHYLQAFDPNTGNPLWKKNVDYRIFGKPLVDGDVVFFGTGNEYYESVGSVYAVDRRTGDLVNRMSMKGQVHSSLVIYQNILYFGCGDGWIYALHRDSLLNYPHAKTGFKDNNNINLGNIGTDQTGYTTQVFLYNTGTGRDSVLMELSFVGRQYSGTVAVNPTRFSIPPCDSQAVTVQINASQIPPGNRVLRLSSTSQNGLEPTKASKFINFTVVAATGVGSGTPETPRRFSLGQNFPNPFNPQTTVPFTLAEDGPVKLALYNVIGEEVAVLKQGFMKKGDYRVPFSAAGLPGGIYFCRLEADGLTMTKKMAIVF